MEKQNVLYAICTTLVVGALALAFLPQMFNSSQTDSHQKEHKDEHEGTEINVDKKFIILCSTVGKTFMVSISSKGFEPKIIDATVCDKVIFTNIDSKINSQIAFGEHPNHLLYPGFIEKYMKPGSTNSVVLSAFGNYKIHDHLNDEIEGEIIVTK